MAELSKRQETPGRMSKDPIRGVGNPMVVRRESGQGAVEYILLVFLAAMVAVAVWATLVGGPVKLFALVRRAVERWLPGR